VLYVWGDGAKGADAMSDFEVLFRQRGRRWFWEVCATEGALITAVLQAADLLQAMKPIDRSSYCG